MCWKLNCAGELYEYLSFLKGGCCLLSDPCLCGLVALIGEEPGFLAEDPLFFGLGRLKRKDRQSDRQTPDYIYNEEFLNNQKENRGVTVQ